jgi:hypothetical protein
MTAAMRVNSSSNVLSTTIGIYYWSSRKRRLEVLLVNRRDGYYYSHIVPPPTHPQPGFQLFGRVVLPIDTISLSN